MLKMNIIIAAIAVMLAGVLINGCSRDAGISEHSESGNEISRSERVNSEGSEHASGESDKTTRENSGEGSDERGIDNEDDESDSETNYNKELVKTDNGIEEDGTALTLDEPYDTVRKGARLIMAYDAQSNAFNGTVENTTDENLRQVRVEVHLSNGIELGPTTPVDLAAGESTDVVLTATAEPFNGWTPHAEVGRDEHGSSDEEKQASEGEGGSEHSRGERGSEGGPSDSGADDGTEIVKADNGIEEDGTALALDETYDTVRKGARLIMAYDAQSNAFNGTVENTTDENLQQVRVEVHLSNGIELGPTTPVDLAAGESTDVALVATAEPFNGWTPHAEVGRDEQHGSSDEEKQASEGEDGSEHGRGERGSEGGPSDSGADDGTEIVKADNGIEEDGTALALDETYDTVRKGARLIMAYDAQSNAFNGTVENTTDENLQQVRVEVHLSNGIELGPTTPVDLAAGESTDVALVATAEPFNGWTPHAEVGRDEYGGSDEEKQASEGEDGSNAEGRKSGEDSGEHGESSERESSRDDPGENSSDDDRSEGESSREDDDENSNDDDRSEGDSSREGSGEHRGRSERGGG